MKILSIGDFHGKFPRELQKLAKEVDMVISIGDYPSWSLRKEFFKKCYGTEKNLWDIVGKKKYKDKFLEDWETAKKVMAKLDSLKIPVITTVGNYDNHRINDSYNSKNKSGWDWAKKDFFSKTIKKYSNITRVDYREIKIGELIFIGTYGGTSPGKPWSKNFRQHFKILKKLFKKYKLENKLGKVVLVTHNMPYDCKLDKIRDKNAPEIAKGKHYGSKLVRKIIEKYQPLVCVGGHFHENQGKCKIGRTTVINVGSAAEKKCSILNLNEAKGRIKSVKFVK